MSYILIVGKCTLGRMDVSVTALRAELATWLERARNGEEVVVTDRGVPVVRLIGVTTTPQLEDLVARGVLSSDRPSPRPAARSLRRVAAQGSVADLVGEQRR